MYSATETDRVLVMIFLNGGNDGLNTVIPLDQMGVLQSLRPHVVLPEASLLRLSGQDKLALHPSLQGMRSLYDEGRMKIIQNVGYPEQDYSHFRSTDIWMSASGSDELLVSGWAGRYLHNEFPNFPEEYPNTQMPDPLAVEIGYSGSLLFQGPAANMGMVIADPTAFYRLIENTEEEAPDTKAGEKLRYVRLVARQSQQYGEVVKAAAERVNTQANYPDDNPLAQQLKVVARLIAGGLKTRMYMVQLGGFDTHDAQVEDADHTTGEHADLLRQLDTAVSSFMNDLRYQGVSDRVMGMTFSEFGRRIVSNASLGTDHGASAPMFIFGDQVEPGVLGTNPQLDVQMSYVDNLPYEHDFRSVYSSIMEQWLCVPSDEIPGILTSSHPAVPISPDAACTPTWVRNRNQHAGMQYISISPNPVHEGGRVLFLSTGEPLAVKLVDYRGSVLRELVRGTFARGTQDAWLDMSGLPSGSYLLVFESGRIRQSRVVVKI